MTRFTTYLANRRFPPVTVKATMDLLQENGIISDQCVEPADVAEPDATRAVDWLKRPYRITPGATGENQTDN